MREAVQKADIEDVYQLSPLQQGMLFHNLYNPEDDVYVVQFCLTLSGPLSPRALEEAWERVLAVHPVLRTSFHWEKLQAPSQVVHRRVQLPIETHDGRGQPQDLARFLAEDRKRGFDLTKAPLLRLSVLRTGPEEHLLVWTHHHLLLDGWSVALVVGQVLTLYEALVRGESRELERSRPFRDYIAWLRRQDLAAAERFWREELAGFATPTPLGAREPLPDRTGFGDRTVRLSPAATAALQALAREQQLTVNTLAQGAWALLLARHSGEEDVLFGVTVSGRPAALPGVETMVGLFINTLPLRVAVEADAPLLAWLRRLQDHQTVLRQYEHSPLFEVQGWSDATRGTPLFHSLFVFENFPTAAERRAGPSSVEIRELRLVETSNYPLTLAVTPGAELALRMIYDRAHFHEAEILRLQEHLRTLLESCAAAPSSRLADLAMLPAPERHQLLVEHNDTDIDLPAVDGLHRLFEEHAARTPDAPAVTSGDQTWTYAELDREAEQRARQLREQGVGPGSIVPLPAERSPEMIAGILAILKAGGAYLPLDPTWPRERLDWLLADSSLESFGSFGSFPSFASLAYIMYTSGSTGRPKGVEVPHEAVIRLVRPGSGPIELGPGQTWLQLAPAAFDASTLEIWAALANGGHLVLAPESTPSLDDIAATIRRHGVTSLWLTSGLFHQMVERGLEDLTPLRQLLAGGDVLSFSHAAEALRQRPDLRLLNGYGPTENTVFTSCHRLAAPVEPSVPIGRPIPGTRVHLLDARLQPVPVGAPGRLFTGGRGLARGYLRRPALTAERFVPDPFSHLWDTPGARLYDTGDLARRRTDGVLEFLGRTDAQVKIRGHRVEPGEVEAVLREHPDVADAVVLARPDAAGAHRLVAWVVTGALPSALRSYLEERLPAPLIPSAFVALDALPLTPNGKVDRRALPDPEESRQETAGAGIRPRTPTEEVLEGIWCEVLGLPRIGIDESFFERGGHSLAAMQVVSRVHKTFGVELPLRDLFEDATVAALARRIEALRRSPADAVATPRQPREPGDAPLSFAQQRLWFLDRLEPGRAAYNIPFSLRLQGEMDTAGLERALNTLVARHEALRTTFPERDGEPVQRVADRSDAGLSRIDLQALPAGLREAEVRLLAREEALSPFDLTRGPLLRIRLLRLAPAEHLLLLTMHHIVSDGWSMGVLVRDVIASYRAQPLPALPLQYSDYAVWQREWLQGDRLANRLGWWRERLAGSPAFLDLPLDRPRPPARSDRGASLWFEIPPDLSARLRALGRHHGATLHMTWLAALAALLQRSGTGADLPVGTTAANRDRPELEDLIGFFVNTLVLRVDAAGDPAVSELLKRARETALEAYAHQDLPFVKLVEELRPERSLAHTPLFQVLLAVQNAPAPPMELPGLTVTPVRQPARTSQFDLALTLFDTEPGLSGDLTWSTDLFDAPTVRRLLEHLTLLAGAMAEAPSLRLSELPLAGEAELAQILTEWSGVAGAPAPPGPLLHELLAEQAERTPDRPAVRFRDEVLTFRELDSRADLLARWLRARGIGPEVPVALCLERSVDLLVAVFGILKAGGAFVPLDPAAPPQRQALVLEDCGAPLLLTRLDWSAIAAEARERTGVRLPRVLPSNLCYVIYTSGSTGRPKGVLIQHGSVLNFARALRQTLGAGFPEPLRAALNASLAFDASIQQVIQIPFGNCVDIVPDELRLDPERLPPYLEAHAADLLDCTPSQLRLFLGAGARFRGITALVGGEALDAGLWTALAGDPRMATWNVYGPTECTVEMVASRVEPGLPSIGRPLSGSAVVLLDPDLRPVPIGVVGQLHIAGAGLARGYLGRPELTAQAFGPDPFGARRNDPGARLYATGDLARWLPDGRIELHGRVDDQVKIRGLRIELGEIESVLAGHPDVQEAVVLAFQEGPGDSRLVAWVVLNPKSKIQNPKSDFHAWLADRLPGPMIPSAFVRLDALPLTSQGKVDRRALPVPEPVRDRHHAAPRTPAEEVLAAIWGDVLELERIGVDEDFFALGGHSLQAVQVVSRIRRSCGVELPLRALFETPTLAALAARIDALQQSQGPLAEPSLVSMPRDGDIHLSFAQQRLWFLDRLEPGQATYNIPLALRLSGELEEGALERTLAALAVRHEVLRTTFPDSDRGPVQRISEATAEDLPRIDLRALPDDRRDGEARRLARDEAAAPFDLSRGPLLRARLLQAGDGDHLLLLTMHHIVSDGWSMGVLVRDVIELYRGQALPALLIQYADYAVWQRAWLQGERLAARLSWWRDRLAGAPVLLDLPLDRPRPPVRSGGGAGAPFSLPPDLSAQIRALGRRHGATLHMTWLAALAVLLRRSGCGADLPVGTTVANRDRRELEDLIGFFVNTLVLRVDASGDPAVSEILARARETALEAYARQDLPFEKLVAELQPERNLAHTPLFQVLLAVQNAPAPPVELPGLAVIPVRQPARTARFDLSLTVLDTEPEISGHLTFATDLFDAATAERLLERLAVLLAAMAEDPTLRLSELPVATEAELAQILTEWDATAAPAPLGLCVHEMLDRQAERTPGESAVRFRDEVLTFREFVSRADLLARHLRGRGIGPDVPVVLFLERSTDLIAALFGILKAGGAFVPLDPATPPLRLELLLEDCGAPLVVTRESLLPRLPSGWRGERAVCLDRDREAIARSGDGRPLPRVVPENLCYVIYTSGSTGRPKGVQIQHASVVNLISALRRTVYAGLPAGLRVAVNAPLSFDGSIKQVIQILCGDCLDVLPEDLRLDPELLPAYLAEHAVDVLDCTPSQLRLFLTEGGLRTGLARVLVGGEALDEPTWTALAEPPGAFWNVYGPTECTVDTTVGPIEAGPVSIGRPVPGAVVTILDPDLRPVPAGVVGELHVTGAGLARGYLGRPDLTAEKFLPDPFAARRGAPGARLYATGDLARWLPDGRIELRGRADHQVKIRGVRIELEEIEAVLASHPDILEASVLALGEDPADRHLVAWITFNPKSKIQNPKSDLQAWLRDRLPAAMIPSDLLLTADLLPRTPSGKLDRQALAQRSQGRRGTARDYVPPRDALEERLAALWSELLGVDRLGVHDSFFDLGGHSLLATRLAVRIRREFGVDLPLRTLFETPTLGELTRAIFRQLLSASDDEPASLFAELDALSEEEAQALLEED